MGYSGNYTGYSVTGFDVFLWILLTAGSIGFPVIVMTICCIKIHFKNKRYSDNDYFYNSQIDFKKKGIVGPYISENCLDKPWIKNIEVIEPTDLENMNNTDNKIVRFKDDPNNKSYIDLNTSRDLNETTNQQQQQPVTHPTSLRNLKEAFNNFSKRPSKREEKTVGSNLPVIPINSEQAYQDNDNNVYSISKSFNNQNSDDAPLQQPRQSFENLYSQVRVQPNNRNAYNEDYLPNTYQPSYNTSNNNNANASINEDNQQPVYMNTSFDDYNTMATTIIQPSKSSSKSSSQRTNSKSNRLI